jgi:hypothetical protein
MICSIVGSSRCLRIAFIMICSNLQSHLETLRSHRAFVVNCWKLGNVSSFQSPGIASPSSDVQWNLHIQLLASPQIDLFVGEDGFHRQESSPQGRVRFADGDEVAVVSDIVVLSCRRVNWHVPGRNTGSDKPSELRKEIKRVWRIGGVERRIPELRHRESSLMGSEKIPDCQLDDREVHKSMDLPIVLADVGNFNITVGVESPCDVGVTCRVFRSQITNSQGL